MDGVETETAPLSSTPSFSAARPNHETSWTAPAADATAAETESPAAPSSYSTPSANPDSKRRQRHVPALVKDPRLLEERRLQIIKAAVKLFINQGFHKTTTRQIAKAAGVSIGSMYEYFRTKEDILYLVCDHIHGQVEDRLRATIQKARDTRDALAQAMRAYFTVCDDLSDDILLIYQESKSIPPEARKYVLANEVRLTGIFEQILRRGMADGSMNVPEQTASMIAHDIAVMGHMWTFRRWHLARRYSLDEYATLQIRFVMSELDHYRNDNHPTNGRD